MTRIAFQRSIAILLVAASITSIFGQTLSCKKEALAALRPLPKLKYNCREDLTDYDDAVLKLPERIDAITRYERLLAKFTYKDWWSSTVDDLNACDFRKKPGKLTREEKKNFQQGDYLFDLFGNQQIRVIRADDPCYQTGFGGSALFALHRTNGKVVVSEIVDGFASRADNAIDVDFAMLREEQLIEVATSSGGLNPTITNFYFTTDKRTGKVIPKNLFKDGKKLTNEITSSMLLGSAEEYGLPPKTEPLVIFRNRRLAKSFFVIEDSFETFGEDNHEKFVRKPMRWNGKYFQ